ncbi:hypothetical protein KW805_03215 [Candidatus Pacearchaeota archaeon]|nr:hypothetical protein [Candidatus Pacearchaeota archaeon]
MNMWFSVKLWEPPRRSDLERFILSRNPVLAIHDDGEQPESPLFILPTGRAQNFEHYTKISAYAVARISELPLSKKLSFEYMGDRQRLHETLNLGNIKLPLFFGYGGDVKLHHNPDLEWTHKDGKEEIAYSPSELLIGQGALRYIEQWTESLQAQQRVLAAP